MKVKHPISSASSVDWQESYQKRLKDPEYAMGMIKLALEEYEQDKDLGAFLNIIGDVAKAQGKISALAQEMGVERSTVYRALSREGNPTIHTLVAALRGLGFRMSIERVSA